MKRCLLFTCLLLIPALDSFAFQARPPRNLIVARDVLYRDKIGAFGGKSPYTYRLLRGPDGLEIESASGTVSWVPGDEVLKHKGVFSVVVRITDAAGGSMDIDFNLVTHDLIPLGPPVPSFEAAVVHGPHLICLDQHGLTVRPLDSLLKISSYFPRDRHRSRPKRRPSRLVLVGDRLLASWIDSVALFRISPSGALMLEGDIPCSGAVRAVAARGDEVAISDGASLVLLEIRPDAMPRRVACLGIPGVEDTAFTDEGLVFCNAKGDFYLLGTKPQPGEPVRLAGETRRILAVRGNLVAAVVRKGKVSIIALPEGKPCDLGISVPGESTGRKALWDEDGLVLPQLGKRFRISVEDGQISAVEDVRFVPGLPSVALGGTLLEVAGPTKLRRVGAEDQQGTRDKPVLFGLSGKVRMALGPGLLGWYEEGRVGAIRDPASAEPVFVEVLHPRAVPAPTKMFASGSGMYLETSGGLWWVDWRKRSARPLHEIRNPPNKFRSRTAPVPNTVLMGDCLVYFSLADASKLYVVAVASDPPEIQVIPIAGTLSLLAGDQERQLIHALDSGDRFHVYRLDGRKLSHVASRKLDFRGSLSRRAALAVSDKIGIVDGIDKLGLIDNLDPTRPVFVDEWKEQRVRRFKHIAVLDSTVFLSSSVNNGADIFAVGVTQAGEKLEWTRVARVKTASTAEELTAVGSLILADFGKAASPLLLASDAGYRSRQPEASSSVTLRNARLVQKAHSVFKNNDKNWCRSLLVLALDTNVPEAFYAGFDHWSALYVLSDETRAELLAGTFLDDALPAHLSHILKDRDVAASDITVAIATRKGFLPHARESFLLALGNNDLDPAAERLLWQAASGSNWKSCATALKVLIKSGVQEAVDALDACFLQAPRELTPLMIEAMVAGGSPGAKDFISKRWRALGDITDNETFRIYLATAKALASLSEPTFKDLVSPWFKSKNPDVLTRAERISGCLKDVAAVESLKKLLTHNSGLVKGEAAFALFELGEPLVTASLREGIRTRNGEFAVRALQIFHDDNFRGNKMVLEMLREVLRDRTWDDINGSVRGKAFWTLARLGEEEDVAFLRKMADDKNPHIAPTAKDFANGLAGRLGHEKGDEDIDPRPVDFEPPRRPVDFKPPAPVEELPPGNIISTIEDTSMKGVKWIVCENKFLGRSDARGTRYFTSFMEVRRIDAIRVNNLAFSQDLVWAATDKGAFCYERRVKAWVEYAVNREHIGRPVESISIDSDGAVCFEMNLQGKSLKYLLDIKTNSWRRRKHE